LDCFIDFLPPYRHTLYTLLAIIFLFIFFVSLLESPHTMSKVEMLGQSPIASDRLIRPLSPATRAGDFVFVSGQVPTDAQGQVIVGGIEAQTRQVFARLQDALALADCTLADVAKVSVWLDDARDFAAFNRVYMECFGEHRPARSTVESRLMIDAKVEMDVTAYKPR
jgi:reactive intermediate/imine deaminase